MDLLTFEIAGRRFALTAMLVDQVTRSVAVAALPKAPPIVEGVINVRGTLVPVLDLRHRFGLDPAPLTTDHHFVIAQAGTRLVALRVDRALELVTVDEAAIEAPSRVAPGAEYVMGIVTLPDGLLVIHDLEHFLSLDEEAQVGAALAGGTLPGDTSVRRCGR